jgi:hypothetical protein
MAWENDQVDILRSLGNNDLFKFLILYMEFTALILFISSTRNRSEIVRLKDEMGVIFTCEGVGIQCEGKRHKSNWLELIRTENHL